MRRAAKEPGRYWTRAIILRSRVLTLAQKVVFLHHVELDRVEKHNKGCTMSARRMADELNLSRRCVDQVRAQLLADLLLVAENAGPRKVGYWYPMLPPDISDRPVKGKTTKYQKRAWVIEQTEKLDRWLRTRRKVACAA
jgi:hypothetical protein